MDLGGERVETPTVTRVPCRFFKWDKPPAFRCLYCHVCRHAVGEGLPGVSSPCRPTRGGNLRSHRHQEGRTPKHNESPIGDHMGHCWPITVLEHRL